MGQADCSSTSTTIQIIGQISSLIIVIVGWFVVHRLTKKRENCKGVFEEVESCCNALLALETKAIVFHLKPSFDESLSGEIIREIKRDIEKLDHYPLSTLEVDNGLKRALRQAITLKNFDKSDFHQLDPFHSIIKEISSVVDDLTNELRIQFKKKFT